MNRITAIAGSTLLIACGVSYLYMPSGEPAHAGKKLSYWVEQFVAGESARSSEALLAIGTNAIPALLADLEAAPSRVVTKARPVLIRFRPQLVQKHYERLWERRDRAGRAFKGLGTNAVPAIPALIGKLGKNQRAELALASIGPAAVPALAEASQGPDGIIRECAIRTLGYMRHPKAVPALIEAASHRDPVTRLAAVLALGRHEQSATVVVPALIECTRDEDSRVQSRALHELGMFGPAAVEAVPRLQEVVTDGPESFSAAATISLSRITGETSIPPRPDRWMIQAKN